MERNASKLNATKIIIMTYANSESHQRTTAERAPEGTRLSPFPMKIDREFNVSSSAPFPVSASMNKSKKPSTANASEEKKLELSWAAYITASIPTGLEIGRSYKL